MRFSGTGFVDYANGVANSFVEFAVNQNRTQTLIFRYANGSAVNRPCNITVNGASGGSLTFLPTGAWTNYRAATLSVNLGAAAGFRSVRMPSTTAELRQDGCSIVIERFP